MLPALEALDSGGTLAIAGIHLSDIPVLNYRRHLAVSTHHYPLDHADRALADLAAGRFDGAAVLAP